MKKAQTAGDINGRPDHWRRLAGLNAAIAAAERAGPCDGQGGIATKRFQSAEV
jgi:hypothetical protein